MFRIFMLFILPIVTCMCHSNDATNTWYQETKTSEMLSNADMDVKGGKTYVDLENIVLTNDGMYLDLREEGFAPINSLFSDCGGYYLLSHSLRVTKPCPLCEKQYIIKCKNPECLSNQRTRPQKDKPKSRNEPLRRPAKK
ncbi:hypothetical protein COB11_05830 [Candidatus Aerophobetes bacterium]|uniref:Uncharacterized protein n=1 Tax=Aerophobetes bacterium TaxID=2030807 RepID=A0A2A4YE50_UNCAE|nr:MAG: hypothetical protein COB11_05830 [Candidatus Aerophobetes bacterium]